MIFVSFLSQVRNANVDDDDIVKRNPRAAERPKQKRQEKNEGNNIVTNFTFLWFFIFFFTLAIFFVSNKIPKHTWNQFLFKKFYFYFYFKFLFLAWKHLMAENPYIYIYINRRLFFFLGSFLSWNQTWAKEMNRWTGLGCGVGN